MRRWLAAAVLGMSLAGVAKAAIDTYQFRDEAERERYQQLTKELLCLKYNVSKLFSYRKMLTSVVVYQQVN